MIDQAVQRARDLATLPERARALEAETLRPVHFRTVQRWRSGESAVPEWVALVLERLTAQEDAVHR